MLPPGQSGYVSITGVADGTGSPHLTDQVELFSSFEYKPHTFNQPGETETPRAGVAIVRDAYGVPAITGADRLRRLVGRRLRGRPGPPVPARAVPARDLRAARRDPRLDLPRRRPDRPPRLLHRRRDRRDDRRDPGRAARARGGLPRRHQRLDRARLPARRSRTCRASSSPSRPADRAVDAPRHRAGRGLPRPHRPLRRRQRARQRARARRDRRRELRPPAPGPDQGTPRRPCRAPRAPSPPSRAARRRDERDRLPRTAPFLAGTDLGGGHRHRDPGRPGRHRRRARGRRPALGCCPRAARSCGRSATASAIAPTSTTARSSASRSPSCSSSSSCTRRRSRTCAASAPPGVPLVGIGHNDHVAWGFTSGLSDEDDLYVEELTGPETYGFKGERAADGVPRRDLHLQHAGHRPPRPDRRIRARPRAGRPSGSAAPSTARCSSPATGIALVAPLRDLGPRAGDDRRLTELNDATP